MKKSKFIILLLLGTLIANAQTITVFKKNGNTQDISYSNRTITSRGLKTASKGLVAYRDINKVSTANYDAYEKAMRKIKRIDYPNIIIEFTGDQSVYALRLEELRKRRINSDVARAAGGIMTILGVLDGNRDLVAAGMATSLVGNISRNLNDDKTSNVQTAMLLELESEVKKNENNSSKDLEDNEDEKLRKYYGSENVDAFEALVEKNYARALALANVSEISKDANFRLTAIWLKAMIASEQGLKEEAEKEYERLVIFDPEIENSLSAEKEVDYLLQEVEVFRN